MKQVDVTGFYSIVYRQHSAFTFVMIDDLVCKYNIQLLSDVFPTSC
jgi:hypothetical protein